MKNNPMTNPDELFKQPHGKIDDKETNGKADSTPDAKEKTSFMRKGLSQHSSGNSSENEDFIQFFFLMKSSVQFCLKKSEYL